MRSACALLALIAFVAVGCSDSDSDSTSTSAVVTMTPSKCPHSAIDVGPFAANWDASTAGITCEAAGRLIWRTFIPAVDSDPSGGIPSTAREVKRGDPGTISVDGYQCDHKPIPNGSGWAMRCYGNGAFSSFST